MIAEIKAAIIVGLAMGTVTMFIIVTLAKWEVWDNLTIYSPRIIKRFMPWGCEFCLCFWVSVLLTILAFTLWLPFTAVMVLVPIISTATARAFLR